MRFIFSMLLCCFITHSWAQKSVAKWYKGNTHTHSLWSDGDDFPEMILHYYKSHGYDFISLSDHNIFAEGEKWSLIPTHPFRQQRYKDYLAAYGEKWVVSKKDDSGRIRVKLKTLEEYRPLFEEKGKFLIIKAEEITDNYKDKPVHIGAINLKNLVLPLHGNSVTEVMQNNLDQVYAQRKATGQTMIAHINHPNFVWGIKLEDMIPLRGERFFEVYNGHPHVHNYGDSTTMGMDELWDKLLIRYLHDGKPLLYGLATDDSHNYLEYKVGLSNPGRGWIMVKADALTPAAIIDAMEKGDFYGTTGVMLNDISFKKNTLKVDVKPEKGVGYTIQFWGARDSAGTTTKTRVMLKEIKGVSGTFTLTAKDLYVRAKIISSKPKENPFQEGDLETAWTQPVLLSKK